MMRSVFAGVSGLKNHQNRMDVIGNNISNVNTTGFKSSRVTFVDTLSQTMSGAASPKGNIGGTNPKQVGLGSSVGSVDLMFQDGSVQSTGKNTDLCITGNGLFVVKNGNEQYYTRDGAFEFDAEGNYVLSGSGLYVQGWMGNNGVIDTTTATGNIQVPAGKSMEAKATSLVTYANNLNANVPMVAGITGGVHPRAASVVMRERNTTVITGLDVHGMIFSFDGVDFLVQALYGMNGETYENAKLDLSKTWTVVDPPGSSYPYGNSNTCLMSEDGDIVYLIALKVVNLKGISPPIGTKLSVDLNNFILASTITEDNPLNFTISGKSYEGIGIGRTVASFDLTKGNTFIVAYGDNLDWFNIGYSVPDEGWGFNFVLQVSEPQTDETLPTPGDIVYVDSSARKATSENPVTVTLSNGESLVQTKGTYQIKNSMPVTTTVNIYDSLGSTHEVPVYFIREGEYKDGVISSTNKWLVSLEPNSAVTKGQTTTYEYLEPNGTKTTVTMPVAEIQFTSSGTLVANGDSDTIAMANITYTGGSIGTESTNPGAPETQQVTIDFTALTQFAGNNTINGATNGNSSGTLKEIQIDTSGVITGVYTNGIRQAEAQVAVAQFTNATGLTKTGNSLYQESNNSGQANVKTAADLGVTITPSALEMSNVDIANEFADMIVTQRGFQSNSKMITVGDEMLETLINMKR